MLLTIMTHSLTRRQRVHLNGFTPDIKKMNFTKSYPGKRCSVYIAINDYKILETIVGKVKYNTPIP